MTKVDTFSNGNCELLVAESRLLNIVVIVFYRPSGKNYSLQKFKAALNKIRQHTDENANIIMMGDFNFNDKVVTWENIDNILLANVQAGTTPEKQGFAALSTLANDLNLEQQVELPTRHNPDNILDLVYTNIPDQVEDFKTSPLTSEDITKTRTSDHNLVTFSLTLDCPKPKPSNTDMDILEIEKYNFKRANKTNLDNALGAKDWENILKNAPTENLMGTFMDHLADAARQTGVPKLNSGRSWTMNYSIYLKVERV